MFAFLWESLFGFCDYLLTFGNIVVEWFNRPLTELFANIGLDGDTMLGEVIQALLNTFGGNITLLQFVLSTGVVFYIGFVFIKFFVDLIA